MKNKKENSFLFTPYVLRFLFGILLVVFAVLMGRTYQRTKVKEKLSLLGSQTVVHTVVRGSQNCDLSTSEIVTLNSDSNFYEKSSLRGGRNSTSNDCESGSCVRQPKNSPSITNRIVFNLSRFTNRPLLNIKDSAEEEAYQTVEKEKATLQILDDSDKSQWTYKDTKNFYKKALKMDDLFDSKLTAH